MLIFHGVLQTRKVEAANRHAVELGKKYAADEAEKRAREKSESANREASRLARLAALADAALLLFAAWPNAIKTYMLEDAMAGDTKIEIKDTTGFETGTKVRIDPGTEAQEDIIIEAFGSMVFATPLRFAHNAPALVLNQTKIEAPPASLQDQIGQTLDQISQCWSTSCQKDFQNLRNRKR